MAIGLRWLWSRWKLPLTVALPAVWVGGEYLRNIGPLALPTGVLKTPAYDQLWMIQVCDLAGVYGLDFALGMINGLLADVALAMNRRKKGVSDHGGGMRFATPRRLAIPATLTFAVWLFIPAYGWFRLNESEQTMRPGPVLAVVQPDIPYRGDIANGFDPSAYLEEMIGLSDKAIHQNPRPELIVWPEAMSTMPPLNPELLASDVPVPAVLDTSREMGLSTISALRPWVEDTGVPLLLGSLVWRPSVENPDEWRCYNSGMTVAPWKGKMSNELARIETMNRGLEYVVPPSGGSDRLKPGQHTALRETCDSPRQFKMRLFPGGEHIPGRGTFVHDWLKRALELSGQTEANLEIEPGEQREVFSLGFSESDEMLRRYGSNESGDAKSSARSWTAPVLWRFSQDSNETQEKRQRTAALQDAAARKFAPPGS